MKRVKTGSRPPCVAMAFWRALPNYPMRRQLCCVTAKHEDGTRGSPHDGVGHASQNCPRRTSTRLGAHDNEIGALF